MARTPLCNPDSMRLAKPLNQNPTSAIITLHQILDANVALLKKQFGDVIDVLHNLMNKLEAIRYAIQ